MKHILFMSGSHPGGAIPQVEPIKKVIAGCKVRASVLATDQISQDIFTSAKIMPWLLRNFALADVSVTSMQKLLKLVEPDLVVTGTASQEGQDIDIVEQTVILAARSLGIPSVAVLDIWHAYVERWTDRNKERLGCLPDRIAIMDEVARKEMKEVGILDHVMVTTGNPQFDDLYLKSQTFTQAQAQEIRQKIGLSCETLFYFSQNMMSFLKEEYGYWSLDTINLMIQALKKLPGVGIVVRLHPRIDVRDPEGKQKLIAAIAQSGQNIKCVEDIDSQTLSLVADMTFGENSTTLIESVYLRRPVASLQSGLKCKDPLLLSRKDYIPVAYREQGCLDLLAQGPDPQWRQQLLEKSAPFTEFNDGKATDRVVELFYSTL